MVTGALSAASSKSAKKSIVGIKPTLKTTCTGVEMFRKLLDQGQAGDNVDILLRGTKREEVERGQVLSAGHQAHTHFTGEIYVLSKDEGGRHTPFFNAPSSTSYDGRDRCDRVARRQGNGHAW